MLRRTALEHRELLAKHAVALEMLGYLCTCICAYVHVYSDVGSLCIYPTSMSVL